MNIDAKILQVLANLIQQYIKKNQGSSQDGGVDRNPLLPRTTRRITTNLKTKNNQKCQIIKLHGTLTTKELKKWLTTPTRPAGGRWADRENLGWQTMWAGMAEQETEAQGWLWTTAGVAMVGEPPSLTRVCWKVGLEPSKWAALFPPWPLLHR